MNIQQTRNDSPILHVRFEGRSEEISLAQLNLSRQSTDEQIKDGVARHFEKPSHYFDTFVIVRNSQAIIVRPEAIYG